jgi:23S rRNA (pseudouridine1915-N3)-methyltransferase
MFSIHIIALGAVRTKYFRDACEEYMKRSAPFARIVSTEVETAPWKTDGEREKSKKKEGERLLRVLKKEEKKGAAIFLLDENGKENTSGTFSELLEKHAGNTVVFVIGGALGFSKEVREKKYEHIALSRLTFPHELARVVLLEQIYRGITITKGKTYHY